MYYSAGADNVGRSTILAKPTSKLGIGNDADLRLWHKRGDKMDRRVEELFLKYEKANSTSDVSEIGQLYADTFLFGGPNGAQAVKKEDFLKVVPKRKAYFSSMGLSETQLESVEVNPLDAKYLLAKVAWKMKLESSVGCRHLETFATYVLMRGNGDALSIVFQFDHQDLASVIKELQGTQQ